MGVGNQADRRYRSRSRGLTTFLALFDVGWLVAFIGSGYEHGYVIGWAVVTAATIGFALADWFVPRTVISEVGIRRRLSGSRRELAWSEVAPVGMTQLMERNLQAAMSVNTSTGFRSTFADQADPTHCPPGPVDWQMC